MKFGHECMKQRCQYQEISAVSAKRQRILERNSLVTLFISVRIFQKHEARH
jgi:hypothetical protein